MIESHNLHFIYNGRLSMEILYVGVRTSSLTFGNGDILQGRRSLWQRSNEDRCQNIPQPAVTEVSLFSVGCSLLVAYRSCTGQAQASLPGDSTSFSPWWQPKGSLCPAGGGLLVISKQLSEVFVEDVMQGLRHGYKVHKSMKRSGKQIKNARNQHRPQEVGLPAWPAQSSDGEHRGRSEQ